MDKLERYSEEPQRKIAKAKKPLDITLLFMAIGALMVFVSVIISLTFSFEFFALTAFALIFYLIGSFSNTKKNSKLTLVFSVIFLLFGLGVAFWGSSRLVDGISSRSWPVAKGTIIVSEEKITVHTGGSSGNRKSTIYIKPKVEYEYSVEGIQYTYHNISFGEYGYRGSSHTRRILNEFRKGKSVDVRYNPHNHAEAVLTPGLSWATIFPGLVGLIFALISGLILKKCISRENAKKDPQGHPSE